MYSLDIQTNGAVSRIRVGEEVGRLADYLPSGTKIVAITDSRVRSFYPQVVEPFPVIEIACGEQHKTLHTVEKIYASLLELGADRNSFVVAVGGGLVCDVAGFAASTFLRGIPFGFVSTTLLSQVDASVGGKNGVNFGGFKNMIGTFNQPQFVICDQRMLRTLTDDDFVAGLGEVVKAAAIRSPELFDYLEANADAILERRDDVLLHIISEAVKIKAQVVMNDEREKGERRILNFGHTFGHPVEVLDEIAHGKAVSIGMMVAARWSVATCGFPQRQADRLEQLLMRLRLPVTTRLTAERIINDVMKDKKREGEAIHLVLLSDFGKPEVVRTAIETVESSLPKYMRND